MESAGWCLSQVRRAWAKTTLCDTVLVDANRDGWPVAWAAAAQVSTLPGLWPWRQLLSGLGIGDLPRPSSDPDDPVAERVAQFDAVAGRVRAAAVAAPVLAVLDDAHWTDPATLALLVHFAATASPRQSLHALARWAYEALQPYRPVGGRGDRCGATRPPGIGALAALGDALGALPHDDASRPGAPARLAFDAGTWLVDFGGVGRRVKDSKGMRDIARLVARPGDAVATLDLVADGGAAARRAPGDEAAWRRHRPDAQARRGRMSQSTYARHAYEKARTVARALPRR